MILVLIRVMMGAFPIIIPNDPIMKMKIEEKALSIMPRHQTNHQQQFTFWNISGLLG